MSAIQTSPQRPRRQPCARSIEIFRRRQILGQTQREVARAMGCSSPRVHQVCRYVLSWLHEQTAQGSVVVMRGQQLLTLNWLLAEALAAWERSKQPTKITKARIVRGRVTSAGKPLPELVTTEQVEHEQCGDPRYLQLADLLLKFRGAVAGVESPKRVGPARRASDGVSYIDLLQAVAEQLPKPPASSGAKPSNVIDLEAILAEIARHSADESP